MPWIPSYTEADARAAIGSAVCWADALRRLGLKVHGKNLAVLRKWGEKWSIPTAHLPEYRPIRRAPRFTEAELREAISASLSWAETLRRLKYRSKGGNWRTLKRYAALWQIDTSHFDPHAASVRGLSRRRRRPLSELLVRGSRIASSELKRRLLEAGIKEPLCELCGQGEMWRGKRMALILDHINGVPNDNRLENLRIACPNCAATFETHCGRKNRRARASRDCGLCGKAFTPKYKAHRYCSRDCGQRVGRAAASGRRRVERPSHEELLALIDELGYLGTGRLYGVSDNAVRKWARSYERERAIAEGRDPEVIEIPTRTWPNRRRDEAA